MRSEILLVNILNMYIPGIAERFLPFECCRALAQPFAECFSVIAGIAKADKKGDFSHGHVCIAEQFNTFSQPVLN